MGAVLKQCSPVLHSEWSVVNETLRRVLEYTGDPGQVFFARKLRYCEEGAADGLSAIDVDNGDGLRLMLLPGRALDIGKLSWQGKNLSFLSKSGFSDSTHYTPIGMEGLSTFAGGFLATCGLRNSGLPNDCGGEHFGFHGRIGQTAAEQVSIECDLYAPDPVITVSGVVREGRLFGASLRLHRRISIPFAQPRILVSDTVRNLTPRDEPLMLLYHFNLGYPLLDENARFVTSNRFDRPVDQNAAAAIKERYEFRSPEPNVPERCYYYYQQSKDEWAFGACVNEPLGMGVAVYTKPAQLPRLCNWHSTAAGDYVMGIEPSNCYGDGRAEHLRRGEIEILPAYGEKQIDIRIDLLNLEAVRRILAQANWD